MPYIERAVCMVLFYAALDQACEDGNIRLMGGDSENEGRVELCVGRQWGTVCDDSWDNNDATVVCKQLNFSAEGNISLISSIPLLNTIAIYIPAHLQGLI